MDWQRRTNNKEWPEKEGRYLITCRPYYDNSVIDVIEASFEISPCGDKSFYSEGSIGTLSDEELLDWMPMPVYELETEDARLHNPR